MCASVCLNRIEIHTIDQISTIPSYYEDKSKMIYPIEYLLHLRLSIQNVFWFVNYNLFHAYVFIICHNHYNTCHTFHEIFSEIAMCNIYSTFMRYLRRFEVNDIL